MSNQAQLNWKEVQVAELSKADQAKVDAGICPGCGKRLSIVNPSLVTCGYLTCLTDYRADNRFWALCGSR